MATVRQFCAKCLHSTDEFDTVYPDGDKGRRFHFCPKPECQASKSELLATMAEDLWTDFILRHTACHLAGRHGADVADRITHDHADALEYDRETQQLTAHQLRVAKSSMVDVFLPSGQAVVIDRGNNTYCYVSGVGMYRRQFRTHILRASAVLQQIAQEAAYGAK